MDKDEKDDKTRILDDAHTQEVEKTVEITDTGSGLSPDMTVQMPSLEGDSKEIENELKKYIDFDETRVEEDFDLQRAIISERSDIEKLRINRNFLRDAEPFKIERLVEDIKKTPEGLVTGFDDLDRAAAIPRRASTVVVGPGGQGTSLFMLNLLAGLAGKYPKKHFLFYTYEEPRENVETRLINLCGEAPFPKQAGIKSNLDRWIYELKHTDIETLEKKAEADPAYGGLKHFLDISPGIRVIDRNYDIVDLVDSIALFVKTFDVGAVFIDYVRGIKPAGPERAASGDPRRHCRDIMDRLQQLARDLEFPLILAVQPPRAESTGGEGDASRPGDPCVDEYLHQAALVLQLRNDPSSEYRVPGEKNGEDGKIPGKIKRLEPFETLLQVRVLSRNLESAPLVELKLDRRLQKISSLT